MSHKLYQIILSAVVVLAVAAFAYLLLYKQYVAPAGRSQTSNTTDSAPTATALPSTCDDAADGLPVITKISSTSGSVGTTLEISGCNFSGFEGDKNIWIENDRGIKGILYGGSGSTSKLIKITLKSPVCQKDTSYSGLDCDAWLVLDPGIYKIYTTPWGKVSNKVDFVIH